MNDVDVAFAIALAPDWEQIDLLAPDADQVIDAPLAAAFRRGAQGGPHARLLMARSLYRATAGGSPLGMGLSVLLADREARVSSTTPADTDFGDAEVAAIELPVGSGLRVRRVQPGAEIEGEPVLVLSVQYLIHTSRGLLTMTLSTPQASSTAEWEEMFDAMARTAELA
ncbi:MAG: hypothetical protein ACRDPM_15150 [Solirubrobacteraceae bacterium]